VKSHYKYVVAATFSLILPTFVVDAFSTTVLRGDVHRRLSAPASQVLVNGLPAAHPAALMADVRQVDWRIAHHTHPMEAVRIDITTTTGRIVLTLRRDSGVPDEFWVFDERRATQNEIGRVTVSAGDLEVTGPPVSLRS